MARLDREMLPLRARLMEIAADAEVLRTELRRRRRAAELAARQATRRVLASGTLPSLEEVVSGAVEFELAAFEDLRFLRDSATEVRLGYASASHQSLAFSDGRQTQEAADLAGARALWEQGWDFGTPTARGVRVYPVGSRAERVVAATEVHLALR